MSTLDSDSLLIPAWPGADHPVPALAAMAALIARPAIRRHTGDRLAVTWSPGRRLYSLRRWRRGCPEAQAELRLEPNQLRWFRRQLWRLAHGQEPRSWAWVGGRLLTLSQVRHRGGPGLRLRHQGLPCAWTGWREDWDVSVCDLRRLVGLLVAPREHLDQG